MDLTEFYEIYNRDLDTRLESLRDCLQGLQAAPSDHSLIETAARAVHSIKGATWTIRDTPTLINDDPPDGRYNEIALKAEYLETHLMAVRAGERAIDMVLIQEGLASLEDAVERQRAQG
jgi:chemotaxis protein histidine kinase CheA